MIGDAAPIEADIGSWVRVGAVSRDEAADSCFGDRSGSLPDGSPGGSPDGLGLPGGSPGDLPDSFLDDRCAAATAATAAAVTAAANWCDAIVHPIAHPIAQNPTETSPIAMSRYPMPGWCGGEAGADSSSSGVALNGWQAWATRAIGSMWNWAAFCRSADGSEGNPAPG